MCKRYNLWGYAVHLGKVLTAILVLMETSLAMSLTSPAFKQGEQIPQKFTCDGDNITPELKWDGVPAGTKSFVFIFDDPDSPKGLWVHWIVYNIPNTVNSFKENLSVLPTRAKEGLTSSGKTHYQGACPPDREHRYFFKLYALDTTLSFSSSPKKEEVEAAMEGHVLAEATLMGRYKRK